MVDSTVETVIMEGQVFQLIRYLDNIPTAGVSDLDHAVTECVDQLEAHHRTTQQAKSVILGSFLQS